MLQYGVLIPRTMMNLEGWRHLQIPMIGHPPTTPASNTRGSSRPLRLPRPEIRYLTAHLTL